MWKDYDSHLISFRADSSIVTNVILTLPLLKTFLDKSKISIFADD